MRFAAALHQDADNLPPSQLVQKRIQFDPAVSIGLPRKISTPQDCRVFARAGSGPARVTRSVGYSLAVRASWLSGETPGRTSGRGRCGVAGAARRDSRSEEEVVGDGGADAHQDGAALRAQPVDVAASPGAGNPLQIACDGGDLAIEGLGRLERDERPAVTVVVKERLVQSFRFCGEQTDQQLGMFMSSTSFGVLLYLKKTVLWQRLLLTSPENTNTKHDQYIMKVFCLYIS